MRTSSAPCGAPHRQEQANDRDRRVARCRDSAGPAPARKTPGSSPARPRGPTTWCCPACCTWRSCAARTRTPGSLAWTSAPRRSCLAWSPRSPARTSPRSRAACRAPGRSRPDIVIPHHPPMATEEVRYVGEAVAVVIARDRYTAADALASIDVSYEPLEPVLDMRPRWTRARPRCTRQATRATSSSFPTSGDIDAAFSGADVVIEREVPAAAADPVRDGTARGRLLLGRRRGHALVGNPDPARAAVRARG